MCEILRNIYIKFSYIKESARLTDADRAYYDRMLAEDIRETDATSSLYQLSDFLYRYYGKKVIILLDEYDTPMQEAFVDGYWEELVAFTRSLFNSTFKTNPALERGIMTGITRASKESIFSDLNNLNVIISTSQEYETSFGFTEEKVFYVRSHGPLPSHWERIRESSSLQCSLYCRSFIHFINSSIFINMNRAVVRNDVCGSPVLLRKKGR